jgi:hypothetical protein
MSFLTSPQRRIPAAGPEPGAGGELVPAHTAKAQD